MLEHPGHLHHPAQLELTPPASGLGRPQRRDQVAGLALQLIVGDGQVAHLLGQRRVGALTLDLQPLDPGVVPAQLLADGLEELLDGLVTASQVAVGRLPALVQLGIRQLEELLVVPGQRFGRQAGQLTGELLAGLLQPGRPLRRRSLLVLEIGTQAGQAGPEPRHLARPGHESGEHAQRHPDDEADDEPCDHVLAPLVRCRPTRCSEHQQLGESVPRACDTPKGR